jgi:4-hydroxybenzoate polyprenyltransferase
MKPRPPARPLSSGRVPPIVALLRPRQWYKNVLILVPLLFSGNLGTTGLWPAVAATFLAFCALSGAVYAVNDVLDAERDRQHPKKRLRPIASGAVSAPAAVALALVLAVAGMAALAWVNPLTLAMGVLYLLLQAVYNGGLKHLLLWDALGIAFGFVLRALAGYTALELDNPVEWLIVCTFLFALYLALTKRFAELAMVRRDEQGAGHRPVLEQYTPAFAQLAMQVSATLLLAAYSLYTFFGTTSWMMFTLPFAFYGVLRHAWLIDEGRVADEAEAMWRDRAIQVNTALWVAVILVVQAGWPADLFGWLEGLA